MGVFRSIRPPRPRYDHKGGETMIYIGVDVHKKMCVATVKDEDNKMLLQKDFINSRKGIGGFIEDVKGKFDKRGPITAVCEATGNYWYILHDTLEDNGIDTKVAHPAKTKAIAQAKLKNDKVDSSVLCDLLRADLVYEAYVPDAYYRNLRTLVRLRVDCVRTSTRCKNRITAIMVKYDAKPPVTNKFGKKGTEWLESVKVSDIDRIVIDTYLKQLALLRKQIKELEKEMARICVKDDRIELLMSMPGIGFVIALTIIAEVVDMKRFTSAEKLVAYAGLSPSHRSSGDTHRHGHITKTGSTWLRHVMVEAARTSVRYDRRMGDIYKKVGTRQGKLKAMVAVARHMLEISWHMTINKEPYRTQDKGLTARKLKSMAAVARPLD